MQTKNSFVPSGYLKRSECSCCGKRIQPFREEVYDVNVKDMGNMRYCVSCFENLPRCRYCDEYLDDDDVVEIGGDSDVICCQECRDKYLIECDECGEFFPKGEMISLNGKSYFCSDCREDADFLLFQAPKGSQKIEIVA